MRRVVVAGMGVFSAVANTISDTWLSLTARRSGVDNTSSFDSTPFNTRFAAEVKGFDPTDFVGRKEAHRMDRFTQFAVAASIQAAEASKLKIDSHNSGETGVVVGNSV